MTNVDQPSALPPQPSPQRLPRWALPAVSIFTLLLALSSIAMCAAVIFLWLPSCLLIFKDMGVSLPTPTQLVIASSSYPRLSICITCLVAAALVGKEIQFLRRYPVACIVINSVSTAVFAALLALLSWVLTLPLMHLVQAVQGR